MGLQTSVSIAYKDIFPDFDQVNVTELIADIPTRNSLEILGYFLAQLHTIERDPSKQTEFLKMWTGRLPNEVHKELYTFISSVSSQPNAEYNFLNNVSALLLIEHIIENRNELEPVKDLTPQQELNLFKAYLYFTQIWTDRQLSVFSGKKVKTEKDLIELLLPVQLPYQEVLEFKDFRLQFLKAVYFFKFCEQNAQFSIYLDIFLKEYNLKTWHIYLVNLLSIYVRKFEGLETPPVINVPDEFPDIIGFLETLCIEPNDFKISDDFLSLRNKPVYRLSKNDFIFLNLNFLVDKIYQGIQFDFAKILVKYSATYNGKIIKSPVAFMSIFGDEFSESGLFYSVMDYVFEKSNYVRFNGQTMKDILVDGEPDYYIRDKAKVYIFEFKNVYINAQTKHSYDYSKIEEEIFKKLVVNEKGDAKGVTQLVNTIEKIRNDEFKKFDNYDFNSVRIFPVIVYVDISFNIAGINHILNQEFRKQLVDRKISRTDCIKDLALIDLDSFIKFQDLFRNKSLKINNCLNEFYDYVRDPKDIFNKVSTFNMFIHNKTRKMNYDTPKMLFDEVMKLLPKDEELNIEKI